MTLSRELREALMTVIGPLPYLLLLLPILSLSAEANTIIFLFVFSLIVAFFYLLLNRAVSDFRANLAARNDAVPDREDGYQGSTPWERFLSISNEALFGLHSDIEPISEYKNRSLFPPLVYSFWGFLITLGAFLASAFSIAWLVSNGNINSLNSSLLSGDVIQNLPLGNVELLLALFPTLGDLGFENRVFVVGVTFITAFMFLTSARNLTAISDDIHRRILRVMVTKNPITDNEFFNILIIAAIYLIPFVLL